MHPKRHWSAGALLCAVALGAACRQTSVDRVAPAAEPGLARGRQLFEQQCALCHGELGDGEGAASSVLFPRPRDFAGGGFKLASTRNGMPTEDDLVAVLMRGMPGSAMPAWSWMPNSDLRSLARYVQHLAVERGAEPPAAAIDLGPKVSSRDVDVVRGAELYHTRCADCHGTRGEGRPNVVLRNDDGTLNRARDLTRGVIKGEPTDEGLALRLLGGVHGTAMPAADLSPRDRASLVAFVRSLIPHGASERLVQKRVRVRANRVEELDVFRTEWVGVDEVEIVLAPLWWRDDAVFRASVSALHDGNVVALRVRWPDPTADTEEFREPPLETPLYADGLAVQLCDEREPPYFGMGHGMTENNMWHWKAMGLVEAEALLEALTILTHGMGDWEVGHPDTVPLYQAYPGPVWVEDRTDTVRVGGMNTLEEQAPLDTPVRSFATWLDGAWEVVLVRALEVDEPGISLAVGDDVLMSFAIWDGSGRDLRGQKSVTLWHVLELEE
jgi:mono/diheme cytochrome c family protein